MSSILDFIDAIVKSIWNLIYAFCNFREASGVVDLLRMIQSILLTFETPMLWRWNFHNYVGLLWFVCDCKQIFCWRFMELIFLAIVTHKGSNKKSCQNPRLDCDLYNISFNLSLSHKKTLTLFSICLSLFFISYYLNLSYWGQVVHLGDYAEVWKFPYWSWWGYRDICVKRRRCVIMKSLSEHFFQEFLKLMKYFPQIEKF